LTIVFLCSEPSVSFLLSWWKTHKQSYSSKLKEILKNWLVVFWKFFWKLYTSVLWIQVLYWWETFWKCQQLPLDGCICFAKLYINHISFGFFSALFGHTIEIWLHDTWELYLGH
jgi:hypothetical protein